MSRRAVIVLLVVLAAAVAAWYAVHRSCPVCQERWKVTRARLRMLFAPPAKD